MEVTQTIPVQINSGSYIVFRKPICVIVTGRPGSGKTTLSGKLAERLWMPVIGRDRIKEGYVNTHGVKHDRLPPDTNRVVSNLFFEIANQYLAAKISVIIEAAFQHSVWEERIQAIRELSIPVFVVCTVDGMVAARRHLQRGLDDPDREFYHGDKRVEIFRKTGEIAPPGDYQAPNFDVPTIHVSTEGEYSPGIDKLVKRIRSLNVELGSE